MAVAAGVGAGGLAADVDGVKFQGSGIVRVSLKSLESRGGWVGCP
jgi:hypothetical protein